MIMYIDAQYVSFNGNITGIRCDINGVPSSVLLDPDNTDYQNIMQLVAEGKLTIAPASF
jgi:CTP-dependent riboflavin kinase